MIYREEGKGNGEANGGGDLKKALHPPPPMGGKECAGPSKVRVRWEGEEWKEVTESRGWEKR